MVISEVRDELAAACFDQNVKLLEKGVHQAISTKGDCFAKLTALLVFYERHFDQVAEMGGCPLLNTSIESDDTLPFLQSKVRQRIQNWKNELIAVVQAGKTNGTVQPALDVDRFFDIIYSLD